MFNLRKPTPQEASAQLFSAPKTPERERAKTRLDHLVGTSECHEGMTITPTMAEVMLERNTGNRVLSMSDVKKWAKEMKAGNWKLTGESIIFSRAGILNDGQHRLKACVLAGVPFRADVRFGVDREAFKFTDIGRKRTGADVLGIEGEQHATTLAGALRLLASYQRGDYFFATSLTPAETARLLEANPYMRHSVAMARAVYLQFRLIQPSAAAFVHGLLYQIDPDAADRFYDDLAVGTLSKSDGAHLLRKLLINQGTKRRITMPEIAALIIKAWNIRRTGQHVKFLRWRTDGDAAEKFPTPV